MRDVIATVMSIVTGDLMCQSIHIVPYSGIVLGAALDIPLQKEEAVDYVANTPPPL